jgi:hypothetical protein
MWKNGEIKGEQPDLSNHAHTGYGPRAYYGDLDGAGVEPVARVAREWTEDPSEAVHIPRLPNNCGWTRTYRVADVYSVAKAFGDLGIDLDDVYLTIFNDGGVHTYWLKSEEDADKLRAYSAREYPVTAAEAGRHVSSPYIGTDQRAMYQVVLAQVGGA